jgi:pimeloyl-ACP methyl ester carboxylesterase
VPVRCVWIAQESNREEFLMSVALDAEDARPPSRLLLLMEGRAFHEFLAFRASLPLLRLAPSGDGHPVLVLPGLVASDISTRPLRGFLRDKGYAAHGWKLGRNNGYFHGLEQRILDRIHDLRGRYGAKISLIGWSLGGIFARQIAKRVPGDIRTVITLGSPFSGNPRATHAWRLYEFTSGYRVDDERVAFARALADPPPVPTTAIYSRSDGICAWQCCVEKRTARTESIEVQGSHCGLGHNPAAVYAIADRLAQPEGQWQPFSRAGWRSFVYPEPV